jgi:hypothetical protein
VNNAGASDPADLGALQKVEGGAELRQLDRWRNLSPQRRPWTST